MKKVFIFCAVFVVSYVNVFAGAYEDGLVLYGEGNYSAASQKYKMACDGKNMEACDLLAGMYFEGEGVRKNVQKSISLYDKACKADISSSCNSLGDIYSKGKEVRIDREKAIGFYERACELEDEKGCENAKTLAELIQRQSQKNIIRRNAFRIY